MDFSEDVTPHELRHAAIPNDTIDFWEYRDLLALGVLTSFVRHSSAYGITLTKLINRCAEQGKTVLSRSYNALIEHRFLVRIEFTYARPQGSGDRSGQRYTKHAVSRVPISQTTFEGIVADHMPGKKVLIPYGEPDPDTGEREIRRVRVLAAEIYCHLGTMRILRGDGGAAVLSPHEKSRSRAGRTPAKRAQPERPTSTNTAEGLVAPEVEKPTSGATSGNEEDPQVPPEVDAPEFGGSTSIKKKDPRQTDLEDGPGGRRAAPRTPAQLKPVADIRSGLISELEFVDPLTTRARIDTDRWTLPLDVAADIEAAYRAEYDLMDANPYRRPRTKNRRRLRESA